MNLGQLIRTHRAGRTFADLEAASHGRLGAARWQQLATSTPKAFPAASTITVIATTLAVSEESVLLATGESLGLCTHGPHRLADLLPAAAGELPDSAITAILTVVRSMIVLHSSNGAA